MKCNFHELPIRSATSGQLKVNPSYNYFEKICLPASQKCSHSWAFERIRGRKFGGPTLKKLMPAFRKEECLSSCLEQEDFDCQSAEYDQRVSQCQLNSNNRFSVNEKTFNGDFITKDGTYYFENNCLKGNSQRASLSMMSVWQLLLL